MILGLLGIAIGGGAIIALAAWAGIAAIGAELRHAAWAVAPAVALMLVQLWLSAIAWRISVGERVPRLSRYFRIRLIREAVNNMLPVAQLGGNLVGIRMLAQRGVPGPVAGAGTTLDITVEVVTQFLFTLMGFAALATTEAGAGQPWVMWSLAIMAAGVAAFIAAQRAGLLRIVEALIRPLQRVFPGVTVESVRGLHAELMRLHRDRKALAVAGALHLVAWLLGVVETWIALWAMGVDAGWQAALVIESLGMAARSAGFAVPGALGVQEVGFVVVCGLFGIEADQAIALSMVKRARELAVGVAGLVMWQWAEGRRLILRSR
ncbi:lysylphosphatidylglycerol synthase domain-containing protein [Methylocella sp.]|uniref:lysylphosphatidylglycerol synthase domain-containing protein n=1 Tax=Methylocella sp. TaxID=1978226 RepID=UPI00378529F9